MAELRHRQTSKKKAVNTLSAKAENAPLLEKNSIPDLEPSTVANSNRKYRLALIIITVLAFVTRFYIINYPTEVV